MTQVPGNKMDSLNLATVFGPNVLRRSGGNGKSSAGGGRLIDSLDEMSRNSDVVAVVKDLIDFHAAVFRVRLCHYSKHNISSNRTKWTRY